MNTEDQKNPMQQAPAGASAMPGNHAAGIKGFSWSHAGPGITRAASIADFIPLMSSHETTSHAVPLTPLQSNGTMKPSKNRAFDAISMENIFKNGAAAGRETEWMEDAAREMHNHELTGLASIPEKSPDPIIELSIDGRVTFCNAAARRSFPGLLVESAAHPLISAFLPVLDLLAVGTVTETDRSIELNGRSFQAHVALNQDTKRVRVYLRDVSRAHETERQMQSLRKELVDQQRRFIALFAQLTEDMQTDLNVLVGYSALACDQTAGLDRADLDRLQEMIQASSSAVEQHLASFRDSITRASAVPNPVDASDLSLTSTLLTRPVTTLS